MAYSQQVRDYQRRMLAMPEQLRADVLAALGKNANELADGAAQLAEESRESGDLIDSIKVTGPGETSPAHSLGGARTAHEHEYIVSVGDNNVRYAAHVEYGTAHAEAHPFFWPAVRTLKKRSLGRVARATRQYFKKWGAK